jgi:hypothetical protein
MQQYWYKAFLPSNPFTFDFYVFLFEKAPMAIFSAILTLNEFKIQTKIVVMGLSLLLIAGMINLIRGRNIKTILICCVPVLLHLLLSSFQLYPFSRRLIVYILPYIIVVCSCGFDHILTVVLAKLKIEKFRLPALIFLVSTIYLSSFVRLPIEKVEMKRCIKYIHNNINTNESIYNVPFKSIIFQYYEDIGLVNGKMNIISDEKIIERYSDINKCPLMPNEYFQSDRYIHDLRYTGHKCSLTPDEYFQSDQYIHDLEMQLSNRVWLLMERGMGEEFIVNKIDSLGYNRIKEFKTKNASVYLYDFGERE